MGSRALTNPLRFMIFALSALALLSLLSLRPATAEIEEAVVECRKTCVEQQCIPEYETCMTKTMGSPQSCRTIRQDCETACVKEQCLP